jgi:protein phosphatase 2C-like protein
VITVDGASSVARPIPRDSRLVAGQTTSLCLPDAARDLRLSVLAAGDAETLMLASDGYGNSFAGVDWWQAVGRDVQAQVRDRGLASVGSSLPGWVADSAEVGGDDVTVAVLARAAAVADGALAATVQATAAPTPPATRRRSRRWPLVAIVVIVVLALAGAAVALVTTGDDSDADDEPAAPTTVTTTIVGTVATTTAPRSDVNQAKLTVTAPSEAVTWIATASYELSGDVDPGATVTITTATTGGGGGTFPTTEVPVGADGHWSWSTELAPYTNQFEIVAADPGHGLNPRTVIRTIEYRPNLPAVIVERPAGSGPFQGAITISGTAEPFSDIVLDGRVVAATGLGTTWSFLHTVTRDETLSLTARNPLGEGPPTVVTLRYVRPAPTTTAPSGGTAAPPPPATTTTTKPETELRSEEVQR